MNRRGTALPLGLIGLVAIALIAGWYFGSAKPVAQYTGQPLPFEAGGGLGGTVAPQPTSQFPTTQLCSLQLSNKNTLATASLYYTGGSIVALDDAGTLLNSTTLTAGTTLSYANSQVTCGSRGNVLLLGNASITATASSSTPFYAGAVNVPLNLLNGAVSSYGKLFFRDSALANITNTGSGDSQISSTSQTMGAGSSFDFYLDATQNTSSSLFGMLGESSVLYCVVFPTNNKFSLSDGITLTSAVVGYNLNRLNACPANSIAGAGCDVCFEGDPIKSELGVVRLKGTLRSNLGDPAAVDSPQILIYDKAYFQDTDSKYKKDYFSATGTAQGNTDMNATFVIA